MVILPTFNDWTALVLLVGQIDQVLAGMGRVARIVMVDDGSTVDPPDSLRTLPLTAVDLELVSLRRNLGNQRALAIGLCHVFEKVPGYAVVVMDGDGEDSPQDLPRLIAALDNNDCRRIVFAERLRRSEGAFFASFYHGYRLLHWLLTGVPVRMGNFSIVPRALLSRLVVVSEIWNHYTAGAIKARLPFETIPTVRATRLAGESKMNFVGLVMHGLSAMSVFSDRIGIRLIVATCLAAMLVFAGIATVIGIRLGTSLAIPGWATSTISAAAVLLSQMFILLVVFVFMVLHSRSSSTALLIRDYQYYIAHVEPVRTREALRG